MIDRTGIWAASVWTIALFAIMMSPAAEAQPASAILNLGGDQYELTVGSQPANPLVGPNVGAGALNIGDPLPGTAAPFFDTALFWDGQLTPAELGLPDTLTNTFGDPNAQLPSFDDAAGSGNSGLAVSLILMGPDLSGNTLFNDALACNDKLLDDVLLGPPRCSRRFQYALGGAGNDVLLGPAVNDRVTGSNGATQIYFTITGELSGPAARHVGGTTRHRIERSNTRYRDAQRDLEREKDELEQLKRIREEAAKKQAAAKEKADALQRELNEVNRQIEETQRLAKEAGGGYYKVGNQDGTIDVGSIGGTKKVAASFGYNEAVGKWYVDMQDGHVVFYNTREQAEKAANELADDELQRLKDKHANAVTELVRLEGEKRRLEGELATHRKAQKDAIKEAKDQELENAPALTRQQIDNQLKDVETLDDLDDAIRRQEQAIRDAQRKADEAKQARDQSLENAQQEALRNVEEELKAKRNALKRKTEEIARKRIWLELGASILKQLDRQFDLDADKLVQALDSLGSAIGKAQFKGAEHVGFAVTAGGALLTGAIKITGYVTQIVLAGDARALCDWINGSDKIRKWLSDHGIEPPIDTQQAREIKQLIDRMLRGVDPATIAESWEQELCEDAAEIKRLESERGELTGGTTAGGTR